jgi:hypothetical protein
VSITIASYNIHKAVGSDGRLNPQRILDGVAAPGTMVTAAVRAPDFLDIFCVGSDRRVYTAAWRP